MINASRAGGWTIPKSESGDTVGFAKLTIIQRFSDNRPPCSVLTRWAFPDFAGIREIRPLKGLMSAISGPKPFRIPKHADSGPVKKTMASSDGIP